MRHVRLALVLSSVWIFTSAASLHPQALNTNFARDPQQPVDQEYTDHIHKYTTDPSFISPLVDYLPASKTVPTPAKVLGESPARRTCCPMPKMYTNTSACSRPPVRA